MCTRGGPRASWWGQGNGRSTGSPQAASKCVCCQQRCPRTLDYMLGLIAIIPQAAAPQACRRRGRGGAPVRREGAEGRHVAGAAARAAAQEAGPRSQIRRHM